jgi:UTP--glucose-1-phosphate uridylyltransferase
LIHLYGTIHGKRLPARPDVYVIDEVEEKPNPTLAELRLQVPGLRAGHYLCFFGMHVLTASIFGLLDALVSDESSESQQVSLSTALKELSRREKYLALETKGARHNVGVKFGVVDAQIALALAGVDRERMLAGLLESIVRIEQRPVGQL